MMETATFENLEKQLKEREQQVLALVKTHQEAVRKAEELKENIGTLSNRCRVKKQQREVLRELRSKEATTIRTKLGELQKKRFNRSFRKLSFATKIFSRTKERMVRLEKIAPHVFDDRLLRAELQKIRLKAQKLQRELRAKRGLLQKKVRDRMSEFQKLVEQTQIISDLLWEVSDLKKEEEEAEAIAYSEMLSMSRRNQQLRRKLETRLHFNFFQK